jgi:predicted RNase H-like HicB family nuclease
MAKTLSFPLRVERYDEDGGYLVYYPDLPGCQTWGTTFEAAVANAEEALTLFLETLVANGDPIPKASMLSAQP